MEARVLPVAAVSVAGVASSVARAASAAVAMGGPASVAMEDKDEGPPLEGKGVDGMTSPGSDAV